MFRVPAVQNSSADDTFSRHYALSRCRPLLQGLFLIGLLSSGSQSLADEAQSLGNRCDQLYEEMKAKTSSDPDKCKFTVGEPKPFDQCTKPFDYFGDRQASHVVLILDSSGSMAGQINGKSKMSIAKQESANFLRELARDLPVGLMVYGHKGTNKESGKQESCNGIDMLLPISKRRKNVSEKIATLEPTGWTPLAGALSAAEAELGNQPPVKEGIDSVPIVYLVSDGEETCGGDPVAAAKSLHESGVQAMVHVIGFDVDEETRAQLEAISAAGGGTFFPANDAKALRDHLNAATRAELSHTRYQKCIFDNVGKANSPFYRALQSVPVCMSRQADRNFFDVLHKQIRVLEGEDKKECTLKLMGRATEERSAIWSPMYERYRSTQAAQKAARAAARKYSIENALPPKQ